MPAAVPGEKSTTILKALQPKACARLSTAFSIHCTQRLWKTIIAA